MNKLKNIRKEKSIKQSEMAKILGISDSNYFKKECGMVKFSLIEAKKISDFFKIPIEEIFFNNWFSKIENLIRL